MESPRPAGDAARQTPAGRRRRRDRRGRGLRGRLVPPSVPLSRKPADEFDEIVLDVVEHLDARWRDELATVEFAVEDVPPPELLVDDRGDPAIPLARLVPGGPERDGSTRPPRIVVFRRPLEARARHPEDLADLVHDVVVDEVAKHLGLDPDVVDPPGPPES